MTAEENGSTKRKHNLTDDDDFGNVPKIFKSSRSPDFEMEDETPENIYDCNEFNFLQSNEFLSDFKVPENIDTDVEPEELKDPLAEIVYNCLFCQVASKNILNIRRHLQKKHADILKSDNFDRICSEIVDIAEGCNLNDTLDDSLELMTYNDEIPDDHRVSSSSDNTFNEVKLMECPKCGKKFVQLSEWRRHVVICKVQPAYTCKFCDVSSRDELTVGKHILNEHRDQLNDVELESIQEQVWKPSKKNKVPSRKYNPIKEKVAKIKKAPKKKVPVKKVEKKVLKRKKAISMKSRERLFGSGLVKDIQLYCKICDIFTGTLNNGKKTIISNCRMCGSKLEAQCPKCKNFYKSYKSTTLHLEFVCDPQNIFYCNDCDYKTKNKMYLKYHTHKAHMEIDPKYHVPCTKCEKTFKTDEILRKHSFKCGVISVQQYICKYCESTYKSKFDLKRHIKNVHLTDQEIFKCDLCPYQSRYKYILQRHSNAVHDHISKGNCTTTNQSEVCPNFFNLIKMYCTNCRKTFDTMYNGKRVILTHCTDCKSILQGQCPKCNNLYKSYKSTRMHIVVVCNPQEKYKCSDCDFETTSRMYLKYHTEQKHLIVDSKNYVNCHKCQKSFKTMYILKRHMIKCKTFKIFTCDYCQGRFRRKTNLKIHITKIHMNEKIPKFRCQLCLFEAIHKQYLTKHLKTAHLEHYKNLYGVESTNAESSHNHHIKSTMEQTLNEIENNHIDEYILFSAKRISKVKEIKMHCRNCKEVYGIKHKNKNIVMKDCPTCKAQLEAECPKCKKCYKTYKSAKMHLEYVCEPRTIFSCEFCEFKAPNRSYLKFHVQRNHLEVNIENYLHCLICNKSFKTLDLLMKHQRACEKRKTATLVANKKLFFCDYCSMKFSIKSKLESHIWSVHMNETMDIETIFTFENIAMASEDCINDIDRRNPVNKGSDNVQTIKQDLDIDITDVKLEVISDNSNYFYKNNPQTEKRANVHREKVFTIESVFPSLEFPSTPSASTPVQRPRLFNCDYCYDQFWTKNSIRSHILRKHLNPIIKNFKCKLCSFKAEHKRGLIFHMKKHTGASSIETSSSIFKNNQELHQEVMGRQGSVTDFLSQSTPNELKDITPFEELKIAQEAVSTDAKKSDVSEILQKIRNYCEFCEETFSTVINKDSIFIEKCSTCESRLKAQCPKCYNLFESYEMIRNHINTTCDFQNNFQCKDCNYETKNSSKWKSHIDQFHSKSNDAMFICGCCKYTSKSRDVLQQHILHTHIGNDISSNKKCKFCCFETRHQNILEGHLKSKHQDEKYVDEEVSKILEQIKMYCGSCKETCETVIDGKRISVKNCIKCRTQLQGQCPKCNNLYKSYQITRYHAVRCHPKNNYRCKVCDFETKNKKYLKRHIVASHSKSDSKTFICDHCNYEARTKLALKRHVLSTHMDDNNSNLKCEICGYETKYKRSLIIHMKSKHPKKYEFSKKVIKKRGLTVYTCDFCNYQFKRKGYVLRHIWTAHMNNKKPISKCEFCCFETKGNKSLMSHIRAKHQNSDAIDLKCEYCPFETKFKTMLIVHKAKNHKNILKSLLINQDDKSCISGDNKLTKNNSSNIESEFLVEDSIENFTVDSKNQSNNIQMQSDKENRTENVKEQDEKVNHNHLYMQHIEEIRKSKKCEHCSYESSNDLNLKEHFEKMHKKQSINKFEKIHLRKAKLPKKSKKHTVTVPERNQTLLERFLKKIPEQNQSSENDISKAKNSTDKSLISNYTNENFMEKSSIVEVDRSYPFQESTLNQQWDDNKNNDKIVENFEIFNKRRSSTPKKEKVPKKTVIVKSFSCDNCNYETKMKSSILRHIISEHMRSFDCSKCSRKFKKKSMLDKHVPVCNLKFDYECTICYMRTLHVTTMKRHLARKHSNVIKPNDVMAVFKEISKNRLKYMTEVRLADKEGKEIPKRERAHVAYAKLIMYYCDKCVKRFETRQRNKRIYMDNCPDCGTVVQSQCPKCEKLFESFECAYNHVSYVCDPQNTFDCLGCSYKSKTKRDLIRHIQRIHMKTEYFCCSYCPKKYKNEISLKKHNCLKE